jgi:gliding motility-associated-like protein
VKFVLIAFLLIISGYGKAQTFPVTGQLASSAFPVCGSDTFRQATVPLGHSHNLTVPGCNDGTVYTDLNPFWYSFTCFTGGTLGLTITPNNLADDYDWMLYDITGHTSNDVYTDASLIITGNWSGTAGKTGARNGGVARIQCASDPRVTTSTFSSMPTLIKGHKYLLLVSHYTDSQTGYSLSFGGGSAVITDTLKPVLKSAFVLCDRKTLIAVLNKPMRCSSLALDGSDFMVDSAPVTITAASGSDCINGFDMDSVRLTLNAPLDPGTYTLRAKTGNDGNTLLDDCGTPLPEAQTISFTVLPSHSTPLDSLITPICAPNTLHLVFSDPILCSSIAADGSDFVISGIPPVSISGASGSCLGNGSTSTIDIYLASPIVNNGNYKIILKAGNDGNTIINECGIETPVGQNISFSTKDTVSAAFNYNIGYGCNNDTIQLVYNLKNGVDQWQWTIDSVNSSSLLSPAIIETVFGPKTIQHSVSNGFCSDSVSAIVNLDNITKAQFQVPAEVCPKDVVAITNTSIGNIVLWSWNFGDGESSTVRDPAAHQFPGTSGGKTYTVTLIIRDSLGCYDTASSQITKLQSCFITVPNAFSPNGDGKNDYLYPLNGFLTTDLQFLVYNRYGQLIFESRDWSRKWDGTISGIPQPTGTYIWTLRYTDGSGKKFFLRGSSVLIR